MSNEELSEADAPTQPDITEECELCGASLAETGWVATPEGNVYCPRCASAA